MMQASGALECCHIYRLRFNHVAWKKLSMIYVFNYFNNTMYKTIHHLPILLCRRWLYQISPMILPMKSAKRIRL